MRDFVFCPISISRALCRHSVSGVPDSGHILNARVKAVQVSDRSKASLRVPICKTPAMNKITLNNMC